MEIIKSFEALHYCYDEVEKNDSRDYIHDFSETGFAFRISLPQQAKIESNKAAYRDYNIVFSKGNYITMNQYHLDNELDTSFPKEKADLQNGRDFIRMIYDDPNGYLAELSSSNGPKIRYRLSYYNRTKCYYYVFKANWSEHESYKSNLALIKEAYSRIKGAKSGKVCH
jgi:hypothetical protein